MAEPEIIQIVGANLSPEIKVDAVMGDDAPLWHLTTQIVVELVEMGFMTAEAAEKLVKGPYWYYNFFRAPYRLNRILFEKHPEMIAGILTHVKQVKMTKKGVEEILKCERINRVRAHKSRWMYTCIKCGKIETGNCPIGKEYWEAAMDVACKYTFNFDMIQADEKWVKKLEENMTVALTDVLDVKYKIVGYHDYLGIDRKSIFEKVYQGLTFTEDGLFKEAEEKMDEREKEIRTTIEVDGEIPPEVI